MPANVLTAGQAVTIVNGNASNCTIAQSGSMTLYNSADGTSGNRTLGPKGMATVIYMSGTVAHISGAGLS